MNQHPAGIEGPSAPDAEFQALVRKTYAGNAGAMTDLGARPVVGREAPFSPVDGEALVFDNVRPDGSGDVTTLHAGLAPSKGEKWLLSQWIRDRAQRGGLRPQAGIERFGKSSTPNVLIAIPTRREKGDSCAEMVVDHFAKAQ